MAKRTPAPPTREVALRTLSIFVPLLLLTGGVVAMLYASENRAERAVLEINQRDHVSLQSEIIVGDFKSVVSDLMVLAESRTLQALLDDAGRAARDNLSGEYSLFLEHKGVYDQARFLDEAGMEVVRINLRPGGPAEVVPRDRLQRKEDRYYFGETFRLSPGEVFVSPFDLNVEEGKIERPHKPTIRFGTPVEDRRGRKRGIVVLNYLGQKLLDKIGLAGLNAAGQILLINSDGHWLRGPTTADAWGFMYRERPARSAAHQFPEAWQQVSSDVSGQFYTPDGLFTYNTVYPVAELQTALAAQGRWSRQGSPRSLDRSYYWKVVSRVPLHALAARSRRLSSALVSMMAGLAVVLGAGSWLLARSSAQHKLAQRQLLQSERLAAIGEAMTGLAHESRNALQRSQAGLEMLAKRLNDRPEWLELIAEIQQAQYYLYELYEEVRGYAAPLHLRCRQADVGQILHQAWSHLAIEQNGRPIRLQQECTAASLECCVDPLAIGQVLRNILENALSASPEAAEVDVYWSDASLDGRPALRVVIGDNGPGLTPEQQSRIFDPFFTTKVRGTGLGMAITRRIVEAHQGQMAVHSGSGSSKLSRRRGMNRDAYGSDSLPNCRGAQVEVILPRRGP